MNRVHCYELNLVWVGNTGTGTSAYTSYHRDHEITVKGKPTLPMSSDPSFMGSRMRYNPEELLVASLSSCHMLWYLHLCSEHGVTVTDYRDAASGTMQETKDGGGKFVEVKLNPVVTIMETDKIDIAQSLHSRANQLCFIANSCNFPIFHNPTCLITNTKIHD